MENNIHILLVEDDPDTLLRMEALIFSLGYKSLTAVDNSNDALLHIQKNKPDLLVMDIDINGDLNGIEVVNKIKNLQIPVIFVTGHDDDAFYKKAQETQPIAYLIKPFNKFTFQSALENAILSLSKKSNQSSLADGSIEREANEWSEQVWLKDSFFIKRNNLIFKVKIDDIRHIQSEGNYCEIISNKKHVVKISLSQLLKKLPANRFIRIHQRYVVQAELIDNIDISNNLIYVDGNGLPLGPKYKEDILKIANRL